MLTVAIAVLAAAVLLSTALRAWNTVQARRMRAELSDVERRTGNREFLRLLEEMQSINSRYESFTRRALVAQMIVAVACIGSLAIGGVTLRRTHDLTVQQAQGRVIAVDALCASSSAVIDAGRQTITGAQGALPTKLERALERLGYPPRRVRRAQALAAARAYGASIAQRVERATHVKGIARPDGSLDCKRLRTASHVVSPSGR